MTATSSLLLQSWTGASLWQPIVLAACIGLIGGFTSGLGGTSPGGALVVLSTLLLGAGQHVAQGISLAAQIPPTSLSGIRRYREEGARCPRRWLLWIASGFIAGGVLGAIGAVKVSNSTLQWSYVGYLAILGALLVFRSSPERSSETTDTPADRIAWRSLLVVGLLAGVSSGYLGIGGGLAIVAGLSGGLRVPQHQAQMISLILSVVPTTIPAAYIYWRAGGLASWPVLVAVVAGLWGGTDIGARAANRIAPATLRRTLVIMVIAMAAYMMWRVIAGR